MLFKIKQIKDLQTTLDSISIANGTITGITAGNGLTGGASAGYLTLDVLTGNGLQITNDYVYLGGTLSQDTPINANGKVFNITGLSSSGVSEFSIDSNTGLFLQGGNNGPTSGTRLKDTTQLYVEVTGGSASQIRMRQNFVDITAANGTNKLRISSDDQTIGDGSTNNRFVVTDSIGKGMVYAGDYTGNFTTHSLVTKGYVSTALTGMVNGATNGISNFGSYLGLGGTISQNTSLNFQNNYDFTFKDISTLYVQNSDVFDVESSFISLDAGTGSLLLQSNDAMTFVSYTSSINVWGTKGVNIDAFSDTLDISFSQSSITSGDGKGLRYSADYTSGFVTHSLITKGYALSLGLGVTPSLSTVLSAGTSSGNNHIQMETGRDILFKDGDGVYTTTLSNNLSPSGNATVYLPVYSGQIAYHATGIPFTNNYSIRSTTNGRLISSSTLYDNGTYVAVGTASGLSNAFTVYSPTSGAIRIIDGTQGNGKILTSNSNGVGSWQSVGTVSGIGTTNKYSLTTNLTANVPLTITHSLMTTDIVLSAWESTGNGDLVSYIGASNRTTTTVDITSTQTLSNVRIVIIG